MCSGLAAHVTCDTGFYLVGENPRQCVPNKMGSSQWFTPPQQCLCNKLCLHSIHSYFLAFLYFLAYCPDFFLSNGSVVYNSPLHTVGSLVFMTCNLGFILTGSTNATCSTTGQWIPMPGTCESNIGLLFLLPTVTAGMV